MTVTQTPGWQPVALSAFIAPGTSAGTHLDGAEFVVWRDAEGGAHVWEDRCPHRGMKLSFGFVRGNHIACLYHGWQYDTAGRCRYIPAHPEINVPPSIAVPTFPVREAGGIVWASPTAQEPAQPPPAIPAETTPVRSLYLECGTARVLEKLSGEAVGPNLFRLPREGDTLLVAVQAIGAARAALHIVVEGRGKQVAPHLAWATGLRREAEQEPA